MLISEELLVTDITGEATGEATSLTAGHFGGLRSKSRGGNNMGRFVGTATL